MHGFFKLAWCVLLHPTPILTKTEHYVWWACPKCGNPYLCRKLRNRGDK